MTKQAAKEDFDRPPCSCLKAPVSKTFRLIIVFDPFCPASAAHKEAGSCDVDPV